MGLHGERRSCTVRMASGAKSSLHTPLDQKLRVKESTNEKKADRIVSNFPPNLWGDCFANFKLDNELWNKYSVEVEELKEKVRAMLIYERNPSEKMVLIDTLERLGIGYHFEDEIEENLQHLYGNFEYNHDYDLYTAALHFRIFRQHGYNMSCDIFNKFKGSDGEIKKNLANDARGMLCLFEAANLATHGDDILDKALVFTKTHLETMIPNLSSNLAEQVKHSMNLCLHYSIPRVVARNYIDMYGNDPLRNEMLVYFAKINYNLVQMLHLQELSCVIKWWSDLASKFPYVRDRMVETYFWSLSVYFEPRHTVSRVALAKFVGLLLILDDTFDSYGTLDELKVFSDAIERWDAGVVQLLPDYLKVLYKFILDFVEELDQQFMAQGIFSSYTKQEIKDIVRGYYIEAKWWFEKGHMPSFDEYMENGFVTSTVPMFMGAAFLGLKETASNYEDAFDWIRKKPKAILAIATIWRLIDDIETYEVEKARGQILTGIDIYMHQYNVTKEDAVKEFNCRAERAWKDLNGECLKPTSVSKKLLQIIINCARIMESFFRGGCPFSHPEITVKDLVISVLKDPIPLA